MEQHEVDFSELVPVNNEGKMIEQNGTYLMYHQPSDAYYYISKELVDSANGPCIKNDGQATKMKTLALKNDSVNAQTQSANKQIKAWSHDAILKLISLYQENKEKFSSSIGRHDQIWQNIGLHLDHSAEQCKNKWKYLKTRYSEVITSRKTTGEEAKIFKYFEEINQVLGQDPNYHPKYLACSSDGIKNLNNDKENEVLGSKRKMKKSLIEKQFESYEQAMAEREKKRQRQHEEKMKNQMEALTTFKRMADAFEKLVDNQKN